MTRFPLPTRGNRGGVAASAAAVLSGSLLLLSAALPARTAWAQQPEAPAATPAAADDTLPPAVPVARFAYRIAPEDGLDIRIVNHPDANFQTLVMPDGTINYPHVGQIKVAGLTAQEVEQIIVRRLTGDGDRKKAIYLHPEVQVFVPSRQLRYVYVIGTAISGYGSGGEGVVGAAQNGARRASQVPYREGAHIFDTLASAGFSTDRPDLFSAQLLRRPAADVGGPAQVSEIDLARVFARKSDSDPARPNVLGDVAVQPDDTIVINALDPAAASVQVIGMVGRPGLVELPRDASLTTLLATVQPSPRALLSEAKIERIAPDGTLQTIPVNLSRWFRDGRVDTDVTLKARDRLIIPENQKVYAIYGAGVKSGTIPYPDDRKVTLLTAWADAGGSTEGIELKDVTVIRPDAAGGPPTVIKRNLKDMVKEGRVDEDVPIQPNDIIYMPPAKRRRGLQPGEALGFLGFLPTLSWLSRL